MKIKTLENLMQNDVCAGKVYDVVNQAITDRGDRYYSIIDEVGDENDILEAHCEIIEEDNVKWSSGDGLPPVGEIVRHIETGNSVEIACYFHGSVVYWDFKIGGFHSGTADDFEPIKSEKDKGVDELNKHLDEWFNNINVCIDNTYDDLTLSQYLYNLGYRKTK